MLLSPVSQSVLVRVIIKSNSDEDKNDYDVEVVEDIPDKSHRWGECMGPATL